MEQVQAASVHLSEPLRLERLEQLPADLCQLVLAAILDARSICRASQVACVRTHFLQMRSHLFAPC